MAAKKKKTTAKKKPAAKKKTAAAGRKKRVPRYVNMEKAVKDIDDPFDRDVFAYIAGWVQPDGRTWPDSPTLKTIAHHVAPDADSSRWAQYMVSFAVHNLEESGLLRIYRDYTQGDEHPRNIYVVNHCYMLDAIENTEPQTVFATSDTDRLNRILRELSDCLTDYQKDYEILAAGCQQAQADAGSFRMCQERLTATTLHRVAGFLQDALA